VCQHRWKPVDGASFVPGTVVPHQTLGPVRVEIGVHHGTRPLVVRLGVHFSSRFGNNVSVSLFINFGIAIFGSIGITVAGVARLDTRGARLSRL
jgi:hypothetical protein